MFNLEPKPTFLATVQITEPGGGQRPLKVHFKHQTRKQVQDFLAGRAGETDEQVLARMVDHVDVSEKTEGQSDADFLATLLEQFPAASADLVTTFLRELTESRAKNS